MSPITTHVLDTSKGRPAEGVPVVLEFKKGPKWEELGKGTTNADGRIGLLSEKYRLEKGTYRITFDTGAYFRAGQVKGLYPSVSIVFEMEEGHYHIPLLLSPFGYSTYRGS